MTAGRWIVSVGAAIAWLGCGNTNPAKPPPHSKETPPVSTSPGDSGGVPWVDVFVGSGDGTVKGAVLNGTSGSTFPGAALPFGMVQLSPDTPTAAPPGYYYPDDSIVGFSLTHLDGAGCLAMRDFPIFPLVGDFDPSVEPSAKFSHSDEIASPGFYEVKLDSGVLVDLTATLRSGLARFTFPRSKDAKIVLAGGFARDRLQVFEFEATIQDPKLVVGHRKNGFFCGSNTAYDVYFAARFDRPIQSHGAFGGGEATPDASEASGKDGGLTLGFDTSDNPIVHVKIGLSYVSSDKALANLDAESPGFDFDAVHTAAIDAWNARLGTVEIEGGSDDDRRSFYTALYHTFLSPSLASDADGDYMKFGGAVANAGSDRRYAQFSSWDTYRSWVQLAAAIAPETSEMMRTLVADGTDCGALPKWPIANQESSTMVGDPTPLLLANAWAFGARDFDAQAGLGLMLHAANDPAAACDGKVIRDGLADYLARGYCPIDGPHPAWGAVSTTMEYAVADFGIAQFAAALGDTATHDAFLARGRNWKNLFDPTREAFGSTGYVSARKMDDESGSPVFVDVPAGLDNGFVEGNAAQYTLMIPQDIAGMVEAVGGESAAAARLDAFFTELNAGTDEPYLYIGNEPGFNAPWIYPFIGQPWKTQELVRRILKEAYAPTPTGLPGNEDLGATSSWQVWAMLGMYPAIPGVGGVVLGSPLFEKATIHLANGKDIVITAANADSGAAYVQSLTVNGQAATSTWVSWDTLSAGAKLDFTLGADPNMTWGAGAGDRPPAFYP